MPPRRRLGVAKKAGIDPRIAEGERLAIDAHRAVLQRADQIFCRVHQREQIASVRKSGSIQRGHEHFERRVARAGAHTRKRSVDPGRAPLDCHERVRDAEREIVVGVHPLLGLRIERVIERVHPIGDVAHQHRAGRIDDVDAVRAVGFHQPGLARQLGRRRHVRHHQKADDIHAQLAPVLDVLLRDVRFRRMRRNAHRPGAGRMSRVDIFDRTDPGEQQHGNRRARDAVDRGLDPFAIGVRAEPVVEARAREAVAMADLDGIDTRAIERRGDAADVANRILVANGVHAVAQRDVLDVKTAACAAEAVRRRRAHASTGRAAYDAASRSPVRSAADVMMSRLPAYFGR